MAAAQCIVRQVWARFVWEAPTGDHMHACSAHHLCSRGTLELLRNQAEKVRCPCGSACARWTPPSVKVAA
eukprot:37901-Chlamydomonas_euryale.AAC.2